jgi:ribonuclease HII
MKKIGAEFPHYFWEKNKGYPTHSHREAIKKFGSCLHHRKSFQLLPKQLQLDL